MVFLVFCIRFFLGKVCGRISWYCSFFSSCFKLGSFRGLGGFGFEFIGICFFLFFDCGVGFWVLFGFGEDLMGSVGVIGFRDLLLSSRVTFRDFILWLKRFRCFRFSRFWVMITSLWVLGVIGGFRLVKGGF